MQENKLKHRWSPVIKGIVFLLFFVVIYCCINQIVTRKDSYTKNREFLEEENNFDVLFFGTSHMIDGLYPMELWNQYGIFSYNLAGASNQVAMHYWELVNALDYTTPKLVVVDCARISSMDKVPVLNMNNMHKPFDFFPLSGNKVKAMYDLLEPEERSAYLWKFLLYHSRWNELSKEDFVVKSEGEKGANSLVNVAIPNKKAVVERSEKTPADAVGAQYLRKMIELCQEENIDILLTFIPFPANKEKMQEANLAYDIAEEYGVNYINFLDMDGIVDFDTDCYDSHSHLNPSGARKVTEYLGAYIQENYDIPDRREDAAYASWHEDYEAYTQEKIAQIQQQQSLDCALMLHYDKNLSTCLYVKEGSAILQDERMVKLIRNISPYTELSQIETAILNNSEYFLVADNGWCDIWESADGQPLQDINTTFGNLTYTSDGENPVLFIQNTEESLLSGANEKGEMPDIQIVTVNKLTGEIVNRAAYTVNGYDQYKNAIAVID